MTTATIDLMQGTYVKAEAFGDHVVTNIVKKNGTMIAGPTMSTEQWSLVVHAQSLVKQYLEADRKATGYYKQTRFWIVNGTGSVKSIDQGLERMSKWEIKRGKLRDDLHALGFDEF